VKNSDDAVHLKETTYDNVNCLYFKISDNK